MKKRYIHIYLHNLYVHTKIHIIHAHTNMLVKTELEPHISMHKLIHSHGEASKARQHTITNWPSWGIRLDLLHPSAARPPAQSRPPPAATHRPCAQKRNRSLEPLPHSLLTIRNITDQQVISKYYGSNRCTHGHSWHSRKHTTLSSSNYKISISKLFERVIDYKYTLHYK